MKLGRALLATTLIGSAACQLFLVTDRDVIVVGAEGGAGGDGGAADGARLDGALDDGTDHFDCDGQAAVYCTEFSNDPTSEGWKAVNERRQLPDDNVALGEAGTLDSPKGVLRATLPAYPDADGGTFRVYWQRSLAGLVGKSFSLAFDVKRDGGTERTPPFAKLHMRTDVGQALILAMSESGDLVVTCDCRSIDAGFIGHTVTPAIELRDGHWLHLEVSLVESDHSLHVSAPDAGIVDATVPLPDGVFQNTTGLQELDLGVVYVEGPVPSQLTEAFDHLVVRSP